ncbi:MAG: hypothetical protein TREMPRED_003945 [Tremellales sp. Tagirdzhanova-0007]|nr:MAG: hypothetical protein TREMPRED_003945 [Tremellales sp. Tagirdzhanova-0007]
MGTHIETMETIGLAEEMVQKHMAAYDPSHDWPHVERVRDTALHIAGTLEPAPDMLVVELAALFHDMAAKYGLTTALPSLLEPFFARPSTIRHVSILQRELILRIIPSVSWTCEANLRSTQGWTRWHESCAELHAVQDADRLDAIGAIGIMRVSAFSGAKGRILLECGTEQSAERHFADKLLKVRDRMKTAWGKAEAEKRHQMVNSLVGSAKELVGSAIETAYQAVGGSTEASSWTTAGQKQHAQGEAEITAAKAQGYVEGVGDRIEGKKDSVVGAVLGDKAQQTSGNLQHSKGAAQMDINKPSS